MIRLIEKLHRRFLDVVKAELDRVGVEDINNVQAVLLTNIETDCLTVGELTNRGYYMGSNVSYNVRKLVENGYLVQERSPHDRRTTRVRLSEKGLELTARVQRMYEEQVRSLERLGFEADALGKVNETLRDLEEFWTRSMGVR